MASLAGKPITHVVFDVDGVFTTGQFIYTQAGKFAKNFGPHDNDGVKMIRDFVVVEAITADRRGLAITKKRVCEDMKMKLAVVDEFDRVDYFRRNYPLATTAYMGDGIHDIPVMGIVAYSIAPANAWRQTREAANFVTETASGEGAVLEACLHLATKFFPEALETASGIKEIV